MNQERQHKEISIPQFFSKTQEKLKEYSEEYNFIFKKVNNECPPPP
jgi:hypothetical protein